MTSFDEIAEAKGEAEWLSWKDKVIDSVDDIAEFVVRCRKGGDAERIVHYVTIEALSTFASISDSKTRAQMPSSDSQRLNSPLSETRRSRRRSR